MDLSTAGWNAADKTWTVQDMWYGTLKADGYYYPHPALICSLHNADFFEIGDVKGLGENNTLYVWVPELRYDLMHVIAAYATYVKKTRDLDGKDTVAFHIRTRPDPKYGSEWEFLRNAPLICENDQPKYLCPDHILFKDSQMGLVHNGRDLLHPLSELEQAYFKDNAYLATMDIYPLIQKLTVYSEVNYAIPFAVYFEPWLVNKKTLSDLGLTMPPNGPNSALWGGAWWETWNIKKLNEYLKKMKDAGLSNLLPLPAEIDGVTWETKLATYLGFSYGASVLNPAGRCGLDANMEKALNETIVSWRENTDWEHKTQTSGYFNTGGGTGILPWRGIYGGSDEFLKWMDAEPLEDPLKEPRFIFGAANDKVHDDTVQLTTTQPGFGFDKMYDPDGKWNTYTRIYPPTGSAFIGAKLLGIAKSSRNKTRAFEVLMGAFSRNSRHHVNCPSILKNNYGGISGYLTAKYATGFAETGKSFYDGLIEHAMFVGTPVAQSFAYGEMEKYNPMQVAFNEILYKRKPVNESLERACKIINYYTKPPCTMDDMEAYLEDVPGTNKATLKYRYIEPDQEKRDCNVKLPNSKKIPEPIVGALPTQFVSTQSNISVAMVGLAAAAMVIEFILIVLFAVKRDAPVIRAASRIFSNLILLGGMLTLASVIIRTSRNGELGWLQCFGTYWFFAIGFGLVLGSLLVKTYRVDRIFRNKNPGFRLSDFQLVCYIAVIVFFEVIFLLVLQFYLDDPNYSTKRTIPLSDITVSQYSCPKSNKLGPILLYVWNALIIFLAGLYAFRTRNVASTFNENIFTVAAISLISIISIVIVPVISIIESPSAIFLMISLGTIFGTILSVLVFAVPKLAVAFEIFSFGDAMAAMTTTIKRHGSGSGSGSGTMSPGRTNVVKSQASDTKGQFSFVGPTSSRDNRRGSGQMIGNTSKIAKTGPNNV
ncbi:hypothetical protein HK097_003760 [Rhizophlyctis rosea]|uniref:G-protein coupled receptors family 3 profile domain-containing protein n=1 Tax=Rhizophlyctis rosea TaxID=64517 RepID=A0AAD5SMB9_9FUNG|nr:hypothetical protein HK097_003760 [Rhizophlyctis rosea]